MRSKVGTLFAAGVVALLAVALGAGTASATVADNQTSFGDQGRAAGLTTNQISTLQAETDHYLDTLGGTQVALNQIDLDEATLTLALPGEVHPRALGAQSAAQTVHGCTYLYFCAYFNTNFTGTTPGHGRLDMKACTPHTMPWSSMGSWVNNQTPGSRARFYRADGSLILETPGAYSEDASVNWSNVYTIDPC